MILPIVISISRPWFVEETCKSRFPRREKARRSPKKIRRALEDALDVHLGDWLAAIGQIRRDILAAYPASEARKLALHVLASNGARESTTCPGRESSHAPEGAAFRPAEQQSRSIAIHTVHTR